MAGYFGMGMGIVAGVVALCIFLLGQSYQSRQEEEGHGYSNRQNRSNKNKGRREPPRKPCDQCIICLENLCPPLEQMPCHHLFHQDCLKKWLDSSVKKICPICHYELNAEEFEIYSKR